MHSKIKKFLIAPKEKLKSSLNRPALSSAAYTASSLLSRGVSFIYTPFFTRIYTPSEFGAFSMFQSYISIIYIIGSLEICSGVIIRLLIKENRYKERLIFVATNFMVFSSAITLSAFFILRSFLPIDGEFFGFSISLVLCTLCRCVISAYISYMKFHYKIRSVVAVNLIESILPPLITLGFYSAFETKGLWLVSIRAMSYTAVLIALAIPIYVKIAKKSRITDTKDSFGNITKKILKSALPMFPYYISMIVIAQGDKVLVGRILGESALGGYGIAYSLGSALTMLSAGILGVAMPWLLRKLRDGNFKIAKQVTKRLFQLSNLLTLLILCLAPELLSVLAPKSYGNTLLLVFPIALSAPTLLLQSLTVTANLKHKASVSVVLSGVIPASLFVLSALLIMPRYGVISIAITLPIVYLFSLAISSKSLKNKTNISLINANDYLQTTFLTVLFSVVVYQIKELFLARILVALAVGIIILGSLVKSKKFIKEPI